jgi:hypothetical protein
MSPAARFHSSVSLPVGFFARFSHASVSSNSRFFVMLPAASFSRARYWLPARLLPPGLVPNFATRCSVGCSSSRFHSCTTRAEHASCFWLEGLATGSCCLDLQPPDLRGPAVRRFVATSLRPRLTLFVCLDLPVLWRILVGGSGSYFYPSNLKLEFSYFLSCFLGEFLVTHMKC